jgi:hypothetical protein
VGIVGASPALAADITVTPTVTDVGLTPTSIAKSVGQTFTLTYTKGSFGTSSLRVQGATGAFTGSVSSGGTVCDAFASSIAPAPCYLQDGDTQTFTVLTAGTIEISAGYIGTLTITSGGGGGDSSPSSTVTPVLETLSLSVSTNGTTCTGGNPTSYTGSWLTLPSASECSQSGPNAKPGATLLGWSTSANFPVARAQAQIDRQWGVIDEEIDGVRMIFIPSGMATFVSGSNNLFPIWSA